MGVLALAAALAGCTGSGGSGGPDARDGQSAPGSSRAARTVEAAYEQTVSAGTVTVAFEGSKPAAQSPSGAAGPPNRKQTVSGVAQLDFDRKSSAVTIDAPGAADSETRIIDGVQYQKVPKKQRAQVPGKKPWVKIDMIEVGKLQYGPRAAEIAKAPPFDPAAVLPYIRAVASAKESGSAKVRDTATTRYDITVDLRKGSGGHGPQLEQQTAQLQQMLGKATLAMRVWLDDEGRVRRLQAQLPAGGQPGSQQTITVTEDFYDYGDSLRIEPPPKDDTADVTKQIVQRQKLQQRMQQQPPQQAPRQPQPSAT